MTYRLTIVRRLIFSAGFVLALFYAAHSGGIT